MPGIPTPNTDIAALVPATVKGRSSPIISTAPGERDGTRAGDGGGSDPGYSSNWLSHSQVSRAPAPLLRFTDLISGPSTGLGDGQGSGAIVTIWAQGVGDSQGTGQVYFTDFNGTKRPAAHVYYWKRADGVLPSGPARLWYSHLMQEIAFSIPAGSVDGLGQITVETGGQVSNSLPFTVRAGNIYHFKSTGSDAGDGSFNSPWVDVRKAMWTDKNGTLAPAGSTLYLHDVSVGSFAAPEGRGLYWNNESASSDASNHFSTIAYPGARPKIIGQQAIEAFTPEGWVKSKLDIYSSNYLQKDEFGQFVGDRISTNPNGCWGIRVTKNDRTVGNKITEIPGGMSSRQQGAIVGNKRWVGGNKIFGNEVHDYGDNGTNKLHHTTYMSIRDTSGENPIVDAWEWGFNFLHANKAKFGIHNYDQKALSGRINGSINVHNNVVCEQGGAGINCGTSSGWTNHFYHENNVLIDTGLVADWDGQSLSTVNSPENSAFMVFDGDHDGFPGHVHMTNNTVYKWVSDDHPGSSRSALGFRGNKDRALVSMHWNNNAAITEADRKTLGHGLGGDNRYDSVSGANNGWYCSDPAPTLFSVPTQTTQDVTDDPMITFDGAIVIVANDSPLRGASNTETSLSHDIYGVPRPTSATIGAAEAAQ